METYKKYENLIRKISWKIVKNYNYKVDFDEVNNQAFLIFCDLLKRYDKGKAEFSTFLYTQLPGRLKSFLKKNYSHLTLEISHPIFISSTPFFDPFCKTLEFYDQIEKDLLGDSRKLIQYILKNVELTKKKGWKTYIERRMKENVGWTRGRFESAWKIVKFWWQKNQRYYCAI